MLVVVTILFLATLVVDPLLLLVTLAAFALAGSGFWLWKHKPASFRHFLAYANIGLGLVSILLWVMNTLTWIRVGDPQGQILAGVVCLSLGILLLAQKSQKK
jgi:hypothetical protein